MDTRLYSKTDQRQLKWGILGCARVAEAVMVPGINRSRNGTVVAVAARENLARAKAFAEKFGIARAYGSYEELLGDPDVQAVYVCQANHLHHPWTIRAAHKGKHVLCEKPFACNVAQAEEMVAACREAGVLLMEAFAQRYQPQNVKARELIREGRIGNVLAIFAVHSGSMPPAGSFKLSRELCGGTLMERGCYCVNTARYLLGAEPTSVSATATFMGGDGVDEKIVATLLFPGGQAMQFESRFSMPEGKYYQFYEVVGETGRIQVPQGFAQVQTYRHGKITDTSLLIIENAIINPSTERIDFEGVHQWQLEAELFADCVLQGRAIAFPAEDGLANTRVLEAVLASARERRIVDL